MARHEKEFADYVRQQKKKYKQLETRYYLRQRQLVDQRDTTIRLELLKEDLMAKLGKAEHVLEKLGIEYQCIEEEELEKIAAKFKGGRATDGSSLKEELQKKSSELDAPMVTNKNVMAKMNELKKALEEERALKDVLTAENRALDQTVRRLRRVETKSEQQIRELKQKLTTDSQMMSIREMQSCRDVARIQNLEAEKRIMKLDIEAIKKENEACKEENEAIMVENEVTKEENATLKGRLTFARDNLEFAARCRFCHADDDSVRFFHFDGQNACNYAVYCSVCFASQPANDSFKCAHCGRNCTAADFTDKMHLLHGLVKDCRLDQLSFD